MTFTKSLLIKSIHFQIENKTAISYLLKMGGTTNQTMITIKKDLEIFFETEHNYFSPISFQYCKQGGRLELTKQEGLLGLETVSSNLLKNQVSVWSFPYRSVCITSMPSATKLSFLENRPTQQGGDAMQQNLSVQLGHNLYAFPLFSLIPRVLHKIVQDHVQTMILVVSVWQTQPWYPRLLQLLIANKSSYLTRQIYC